MLTGMRVIAPKPELPDNYNDIPPFSAHDAMCEDIIKDERLPSTGPVSTKWVPKQSTYDDVKKAWAVNPDLSSRLATAWANAFNWKDKLSGSPPTVLVDKFKDVYLSCPGVTAAA